MDERSAFLAAIRANPDDNLPRLVFADWLEEHDEFAQAELIRVQCELHPIRYQWHRPDVQSLLAQEQQLLPQVHPAGLASIPRTWMPFERGFPERLMLGTSVPPAEAANIFAQLPTIQHLCCPLRLMEMQRYQPTANRVIDRLEIIDRVPENLARQLLQPRILNLVRTWRIWSGAAPELLQSLRYIQRQTGKPNIEIVSWFNTHASASLRGWYEDPRRNDDSEGLPLIQPPEWGYTLSGDVGGGHYAGHLRSGSPVLISISANARRVYLTHFDHSGGFSKTLWEDQHGQPWTLPGIEKRFGFTLGTIHAKEFRSGRLFLKTYSTQQLQELIRNYSSNPPSNPSRQLGIDVMNQAYYWRSFTLELDGAEHRVLYPMDLLWEHP